jgi:hypothetical protein
VTSSKPTPPHPLDAVPQGNGSIPLADADTEFSVRTDARDLRILLWCNYDPFNAATVCDHINALAKLSRFNVTVLSRIGSIPDDVDLNLFDAVVIHYSLALALDSYISAKSRFRLAEYRGLKVLFIQDEYRFVERTRESIRQLGISLVFTCVPAPEIPKVYPAAALPGVTFVNVLTGYVPAWLTTYPAVPLAKRRIDVGYRGRDYPAWHGRAGREKIDIGKRFLKDAKGFGLRCDIRWRERDRLYGVAWRRFLQNCRATLAVESGASVFDFEGRIGPRVETFEKLLGKKADYDAVRARFFAEDEDQIELSQISSRVFEAAALRTLLIMYEGRYSGVLDPWVHYLPLKKNHSNMAEVVTALRDDFRVGEIIATAFADIAMNDRWSYRSLAALFDEHIVRAIADRLRGDNSSSRRLMELFEERVGRMLQADSEAPSKHQQIDDINRRYGIHLIDNPHEMATRQHPLLIPLRRVARGVRRRLRV